MSSIRSTFEKFDLSDVYLNEIPSTTTATNCQLFDREKVVFTQSALNSIQTLPKMQTYRLLVQTLGPKDYLFTTRDVKNRVAMTKLRLSNHNLSIEKGIHQDVHLSDRNCPFCPEHLENELHFLIQCPIYKNLRARLLADIEVLCIGFSYPQDENFLFWFLLSNPIISDSTAKYIRLSMELREFLTNKYRNND